MLNINGCINIYSRIQKLLNILIALCVTAALCVCMGKLVHKHKLRFSFQRRINIKFMQCDSVIFYFFGRKKFQAVQKRCRFRACVRFDITSHHIYTLIFCYMSCFEHSISFPDACCISKKDFQMPFGLIFFFNSDYL